MGGQRTQHKIIFEPSWLCGIYCHSCSSPAVAPLELQSSRARDQPALSHGSGCHRWLLCSKRGSAPAGICIANTASGMEQGNLSLPTHRRPGLSVPGIWEGCGQLRGMQGSPDAVRHWMTGLRKGGWLHPGARGLFVGTWHLP